MHDEKQKARHPAGFFCAAAVQGRAILLSVLNW